LREVKLWEVSLTPFPMNEAATVRTIKSAQLLEVRSALHELRREVLAGLKG
jgi:phage head maturation protease